MLSVEIESCKDYTKHVALSNVLANEDYAIPAAYVFHNGNVSPSGRVTYLPGHMLMFIQREKSPEELIYKIDLDALK